MDSNITLLSNVYINKTAKRDDRDVLEHIMDYYLLQKIKKQGYGGLFDADIWMTDLQKQVLAQGPPECLEESGTKSWGVPVGGRQMRCRCEEKDCSHFPECSKLSNFDSITREAGSTVEPVAVDPLSIDLMIELALNPVSEEHSQPEILPVIPPAQPEEPVLSETEHKLEQIVESKPTPVDEPSVKPISTNEICLATQKEIIYAKLSDRIWVNAGPGTGKTYTVIQRIKFLLSSSMEKPIVVLCFSRNAVQVVLERLYKELGAEAEALLNDDQILIRTFDSFASYMLDDELNTDWDYNQRIEEFIMMLGRNNGVLDDAIGYLIVDEIQDTVGVRARMLLAMLDELSCGALLMGDKCQAVFNWTIRDKPEPDLSFDDLTDSLSKRCFKRFELDGNYRQSKELASLGQQLRAAVLSDDEGQQEAAVTAFKESIRGKWQSYSLKGLPKNLRGRSELILTKTNGEAAQISQKLFEKADSLNHVMKQSASHRSLASWIAKVLSGNNGYSLSKDDFMKNALQYAISDSEGKWDVLKSLDRYPNAPTLHIQEVLSALIKMEGLPESCLNQFEDCAIVSTVHRAKGSEADHVFWLDGPLLYSKQEGEEGALSDAIRASYVAATRAKKSIHLIEQSKSYKSYMRTTNDKRWIKTGLSRSSKKVYCKGIAFLPDDVDADSFAFGENAFEKQEVLSRIERGMFVDLYPNDALRRFEIIFDGQCIGLTSASFTKHLFEAFEETNKNRNWPSSINEVFITAVTTIVSPNSTTADVQYATAGCWLGIELGGFPNINWW